MWYVLKRVLDVETSAKESVTLFKFYLTIVVAVVISQYRCNPVGGSNATFSMQAAVKLNRRRMMLMLLLLASRTLACLLQHH